MGLLMLLPVFTVLLKHAGTGRVTPFFIRPCQQLSVGHLSQMVPLSLARLLIGVVLSKNPVTEAVRWAGHLARATLIFRLPHSARAVPDRPALILLKFFVKGCQ